jgi:hypothetical protein
LPLSLAFISTLHLPITTISSRVIVVSIREIIQFHFLKLFYNPHSDKGEFNDISRICSQGKMSVESAIVKVFVVLILMVAPGSTISSLPVILPLITN